MSGDRRPVPCAGCTACCRGESIILHPEDGDRAEDFDTRPGIHPVTGEPCHVVRQRPDGACVYLGALGCTIHERAPAICRTFDCRRFFAKFASGELPLSFAQAIAGADILQAGQDRLASLGDTDEQARA